MISVAIAGNFCAAVAANKIFDFSLEFFGLQIGKFTGADGGTRTHKPGKARDFKSLVYTIPPHRRGAFEFLEATTGIEPVHRSFADSRLTTWLRGRACAEKSI